jgi:hypothetical protein
MKELALHVPGWFNNEIFNANHPANCDNWHMPFIKLKERLHSIGYDLRTVDLATNAETLLAFGEEYPRKFKKQFFFVYENQFIKKFNLSKKINQYKKIFTWNDDDVDSNKIIKYYYPQYFIQREFNKYEDRALMLSMIANNKCVSSHTPNDMYLERQKIIEYFENFSSEFELFGTGWNLPFMKNSFISKANNRLKIRPRSDKLNVYKGFALSKASVYENCKFSICFENVKNINGYITEKIFDSFYSGCVPVYSGAKNVGLYIPKDCYIDYEEFEDIQDLHLFLSRMTPETYHEYQINIANYLKGADFMKFSYVNFCDIILNNVIND